MSDILTEERALQNAKVTSFCFKKQLPPPPKNLGTPSGEIASDLYGPQFWDDNFQFSFSVVVSCKSNKQLGYF